MRLHRGQLGGQVPGRVDLRRDLLVGDAHGQVPVAHEPGVVRQLDRRRQRRARHRGGVELRRRAGQLVCPPCDPVRLDVIRVTVEAVGVVGHDGVGRDLLDDLDQVGGGLLDRRLPEAARVVVVGQAHHPRVPVLALAAEEPVVLDAERPAGAVELDDPVLAELVGQQMAQIGRDDLPELAQRAGHERDPGPLGGVLGHRRPGPDRLVVRVRVHQQQASVNHQSIMPPTRPGMIGDHDGELSQAAGADARVPARGTPGLPGIGRRRQGDVPALAGGRRPGDLSVGGGHRDRRRAAGGRPAGAGRGRGEPPAGGTSPARAGPRDRRRDRGLRHRPGGRAGRIRALGPGLRGPAGRGGADAAAGPHPDPRARPAPGLDRDQGRVRP